MDCKMIRWQKMLSWVRKIVGAIPLNEKQVEPVNLEICIAPTPIILLSSLYVGGNVTLVNDVTRSSAN